MPKKVEVKINLKRLEHLLELYALDKHVILKEINKGRVNKLSLSDVFSETILLSILRKVDAFFGKGVSFYTDPSPLPRGKSVSIFFRKESFADELTSKDRWRINKLESEFHHLSAIAKLSDYQIKRKLKKYRAANSAQTVANEVREIIGLEDMRKSHENRNARDYLKSMIGLLSDWNILVHEFVEAYNLKNKTSWMGMFLKPNIIVIKRQQSSFRREIFTLAHELGHYLLDSEEVDKDPANAGDGVREIEMDKDLKKIEDWCNEFAFNFLLGSSVTSQLFDKFKSQQNIDNPEIKKIARSHHISRLAVYTHFVLNRQITWDKYRKLKRELKREYDEQRAEYERERDLLRAANPDIELGGSLPKPIDSPLVKEIYRHAFFKDVVEEMDIVDRFKPGKDKIKDGFIDEFLYGETQ